MAANRKAPLTSQERERAAELKRLCCEAKTLLAEGKLDEARVAIERALEVDTSNEAAQVLKRRLVEAVMWQLVAEDFASWTGGKPKGSKRPVKLTPGPSITEMIHEGRR